MSIFPNTDDGTVYISCHYSTSSAAKLTGAIQANGQTDWYNLAKAVTYLRALPRRINGFEAQMKAVNSNLVITYYDKTFAVAGSDLSGFPEGIFQHSSANAIAQNRCVNVAGGYLADPTYSGSFTAEGFTATSWTDYQKQEELANMTNNPQYAGISQDLNSFGGFSSFVHVAVNDFAYTNGSPIVKSLNNAPFNSRMVGKNIVLDTGGATGGSFSSTVLSYQSPSQLTMNTNALNTVANSGTGKVGASAWNINSGAPYTDNEFFSLLLNPYDVATLANMHTHGYIMENNGMITGVDAETIYIPQGVLTNCDGQQCEHWIRQDNDTQSTLPTAATLASNLQMALDVQAAGKFMNCMNRLISSGTNSFTKEGNYGWRQLCTVAYYLCNRGQMVFHVSTENDSTPQTDPTWSIYYYQLGAPVGPSTNNIADNLITGVSTFSRSDGKTGAYFRTFASGAVIYVCDDDTAGGPVTITFNDGHAYRDAVTGTVYASSITIDPTAKNGFGLYNTSSTGQITGAPWVILQRTTVTPPTQNVNIISGSGGIRITSTS